VERYRFNTQIYDEAGEWFIECRAGDLSEASRRELDRWLRKSPEHLSAYLEIAAIWNEGPALDPENQWGIESLVSQAAEDKGNVIPLTRPLQQPAPPRRWLVAAVGIVILGVGIAVWLMPSKAPTYLTATGEQRSLTLDDGSTIDLNSRSRIQVRYSRHERTIDLLEGEALFNVAKDSARPFVVRSGATPISVLGTQFDVYKKPGGTIVSVVEGRVAIENIILDTGEQAIAAPGAVRKSEHPNVAGITAWTQHQIVFDSASLAEVAEEFNRYNQRQLVIQDAALGKLHISGVFSSTDSTSLVRFLRLRPGLHITETAAEIRVAKDNP
jgi:transmembrane sensor